MTDETRQNESERLWKLNEMEPLIVRQSATERGGPRVVSLIAGKGGVGQSVLCANLGVFLAQTGKRVLLVDAVRWGQNLHTLLGMSAPPALSLDALLDNRAEDIQDIIVETPFQKLKLLCGARETPFATSSTEVPFLIRELRKLPFDFILIDQGSHLSFSMFDQALWSTATIIVGMPEPTAIESTYELLRGLYYRLFKTIEAKLDIQEVSEKAMLKGVELGIKTPRDLVNAIHFFRPEAGERMQREISRFRLELVLNQVRSAADGEVGHAIRTVCQRYFGLPLNYLGMIEADSVVHASVRQRKPLHVIKKDSTAASQIEQIAHRMMSQDIRDKQDSKKG